MRARDRRTGVGRKGKSPQRAGFETADEAGAAPTLTDGVVVLDALREDDVERHLAGEDNEHARRFGWYPARSTEATVRAAFARWSESWRTGGSERTFAVRAAVSGELVGGCQLRLGERGHAEASYWTFPPMRTRGYARRALRLVSAWAFTDLGVERLEVQVDLDNLASRRVAEGAGFTQEAVLPADGSRRRDTVLYVLRAEDAGRLRG